MLATGAILEWDHPQESFVSVYRFFKQKASNFGPDGRQYASL